MWWELKGTVDPVRFDIRSQAVKFLSDGDCKDEEFADPSCTRLFTSLTYDIREVLHLSRPINR